MPETRKSLIWSLKWSSRSLRLSKRLRLALLSQRLRLQSSRVKLRNFNRDWLRPRIVRKKTKRLFRDSNRFLSIHSRGRTGKTVLTKLSSPRFSNASTLWKLERGKGYFSCLILQAFTWLWFLKIKTWSCKICKKTLLKPILSLRSTWISFRREILRFQASKRAAIVPLSELLWRTICSSTSNRFQRICKRFSRKLVKLIFLERTRWSSLPR